LKSFAGNKVAGIEAKPKKTRGQVESNRQRKKEEKKATGEGRSPRKLGNEPNHPMKIPSDYTGGKTVRTLKSRKVFSS